MIKQILDGTDPAAIPVGFMTDPSDITLRINLDTARSIGMSIPQSVIDQAAVIVENGVERAQ